MFERNTSSVRRFNRVLQYTWQEWPTLLTLFAIVMFASAAASLQPWSLKFLADVALAEGAPPEWIAGLVGSTSVVPEPMLLIVLAALASLTLSVAAAAADAARTWVWASAGQRMTYRLAADLFRQLQRLSLAFHTRRTVGDSLHRVTADSWCVYTIAEGLLVSPVRHALTLLTVGVLSWTLDPLLTALSLAFTPFLTIWAYFAGVRIKVGARRHSQAKSRLLAFTHQTLAAVPIVQAFAREHWNRHQFLRLAAEAVALSRRATFLNQTFSFVNGLATTAGIAIVLYVGGTRVLSGALSLGALLVFVAYVRAIENATKGLLATYASLRTAEASIDRVVDVLDAPEMVRESPGAAALPKGGAGARGHLRVDNVTFGYEPGRPVLQEVSLEARPGEIVALAGPSGSGKSTLVSLFPRFFDPWQGCILLDGCDIRSVQLASLREQFAIVLQEPFLMPLSVADNIAYGRAGASHEEIVAAAVAANADPFIRRLPDGYDTFLGERGVTLSGGERQRLAIARALVKDAPVLILDEPTSALDVDTEASVMEALERLIAGRTTIIIAHRLATLRKAHRVAVLDQGRVINVGATHDLLAAPSARSEWDIH